MNATKIKVVVTASGFRSERSGGQRVWKALVDDWTHQGFPVVSEDDHPMPSSYAERPLAHALWSLRRYGSLENAIFVADQGEALRLALLLRRARRRSMNRLIVVVHHLREVFRYGNGMYVRLATWNETSLLRLAHRVVVHTQDTAREVAERGVPEGRIQVIPLGTRRDVAPLQIRPLGPEEPLRLLWVGGDFERKGLFLLLEALEQVAPPRPVVTVVGRPLAEGEMAAARAQTAARGLEHSVSFLGFIPPDHFEHLWQSHDAYVLPSLHEGHGLALDEALARGVPALLSDLPVFLERIPADEALFVPRGDVRALALGMGALRNHELRQQLSRSGLTRSQSFPEWGETLRAYASLIREEMAALARASESHA